MEEPNESIKRSKKKIEWQRNERTNEMNETNDRPMTKKEDT